ncbi:MAG: ribosome-associated translation inhibitor RaiA [Clostridia bacterium]
MKLDLTGLHIEVTEGIREFTLKKMDKINKFFEDTTICHVTFQIMKEKQHVDIRIEFKGHTYMAETNSDVLYEAIDECIDKIVAQIKKQKELNLEKRKTSDNEIVTNLPYEKILKEEGVEEDV